MKCTIKSPDFYCYRYLSGDCIYVNIKLSFESLILSVFWIGLFTACSVQ